MIQRTVAFKKKYATVEEEKTEVDEDEAMPSKIWEELGDNSDTKDHNHVVEGLWWLWELVWKLDVIKEENLELIPTYIMTWIKRRHHTFTIRSYIINDYNISKFKKYQLRFHLIVILFFDNK